MDDPIISSLSDLGEGFLLSDGSRILAVNDAMCKITGYTSAEMLALRSLVDVIVPEEREANLERLRRRLVGERVPEHYQTTIIRKDGTKLPLEVAIRVVGAANALQLIALVRPVGAGPGAVRIGGEITVEEMKDAILTAVSHELRTPLTTLLGVARTLAERGERLSADERRSFAETIVTKAERLERLLADLLDVDRLGRGVVEPRRRPTDIGALVRAIAAESGLVDARPVTFDIAPVVAHVDAPKVERIVENLCVNVMRHTPDGTPAWITVSGAGEGVLIVVADAGPGVPRDLADAVFEPFRRGSEARAAPGLGVGLSLVDRFARLHGGRAWVDERPGGGAAFHVLLPDA